LKHLLVVLIAAALVACVASAEVRYDGIDVSYYQGEVDWTAVRADGVVFAFVKATEGESEVDPRFAVNWHGAQSAGVVRGAYHFFDPDVDARAQAEHFIATVHLEAGDLPPALDVEVAEGVSIEGIEDGVRVWLETVAKAFGVTPILYSDPTFLDQHLASGFAAYPLWIAEYSASPPAAPGDWNRWTFWQHSQSGAVEGVEGAVDLDLYQGSNADWQALLVR
jgi:lysozyme